MSRAEGRAHAGTDVSASRQKRRRELAVLLPASTLTVMAGTVLAPVLEPMRDALTLGASGAGFILTAHTVGLVVAGPAIGWISAWLGVRFLLVGGLAIYALAGAGGMLADTFQVLLASRIVFGVGVAAVFTGTTVGLLNHADGSDASRSMGRRTVALSVGGVSWPLLSGFLGAIGWRFAFLAHLVALPVAALALLWLPGTGAIASRHRARVREASFRPRIRLIGVFGLQFIASVLLFAVVVFTPLRLGDLDILDPRLVALSPILVSATMSASGLLFARIRVAFGDARLLFGAFLLWSAALVAIGTSGNPFWIFVACAAFGSGMGVAVPSLTLLVNRHADEASLGAAVAVLGSVTFGGQLVSPLLLGPLAEASSVAGALGIAAALAASSAVVALRFGSEVVESAEE